MRNSTVEIALQLIAPASAICFSYRAIFRPLLFIDHGLDESSRTAVRTKFVSRTAQARRKILCIEDDRETPALIAEEVERDFDVSVACSGQEGLLAVMKATAGF